MRPLLVGLAQGTILGFFAMGFDSEPVRISYIVCCWFIYMLLGDHLSKKYDG